MIEGFIQVGNALLKEGNLLANLIDELSPIRNGKTLLILKLNYKQDGIEIDITEEMSDESAEKYLYVGSADGPNSPQWFATSKSINYFLTETLFNLTKIDLGIELNNKIKNIHEKFYIDLGDDVKNTKYRYALNLKKYLNIENEINDIYSELKQNGKDNKEIVKELVKEFEKYLKSSFDLKLNEIGLFTILIDNQPIILNKEYQGKVLEAKRPKLKEPKKNTADKRICSICGATENVTDDLSKMKIKYYTTNQVIFANNLSLKNYHKNMQLCQVCIDSLLAGEVYIKNKLDTKLGDFKVYLVPHFIFGTPLSKNELDHAIEKISKSFNVAKNLKSIDSFEQDIFETLDLRDDESYFMLNFIFYKPNQQATKIQRLIKDVAPNIFSRILQASKKANTAIKEAMNIGTYRKYIDLQNIYYLIPIKVKQGDITEYRDLLDIYDALLTGRELDKKHIIDKFIDAINVIRLDKEGYNIKSKWDLALEFYLLDANMMINFLGNIANLKGANVMDVTVLKVKEEIKRFIEKMNYNEQQSAMFIMGYLIGEVGNAQYKRLDGNKPILNKLNFNGIDKTKIVRLTNEIFAKLKQEKIRSYNEVTFYELKRLIDSNISFWKLNKNENLFYLLSGYSFATTLPILKEEKKDE